MASRAAIILAAGKGTRMHSSLPKVLHKVGGRAMLDWSVALAKDLQCDPILIVIGSDAPVLYDHACNLVGQVNIVIQDQQLGTGHAVGCAAGRLSDFSGQAIVLYGDTPLLGIDQNAGLANLAAQVNSDDKIALGVLGFDAVHPGAYGRMILDESGFLDRIVEADEASEEELRVNFCNSGVMIGDAKRMFELIAHTKSDNAAGEYYLTDLVSLARADGAKVLAGHTDESVAKGANTRQQLADMEALFQADMRNKMMTHGVTLMDPQTVYFSYDTEIGEDVIIEPHVVFGPGVKMGSHIRIHAFSHIQACEIGDFCQIGPFARIRPGTKLAEDVRIGNFVEVKNTIMARESKASHLAYLGDGEIGQGTNIGAGTIFCNYDGYTKSKTIIGNSAFVGSNAALIAPVSIGDGAYIGSGSVITKDVPEDALAVARGKQMNKAGWAVNHRSSNKKSKG